MPNTFKLPSPSIDPRFVDSRQSLKLRNIPWNKGKNKFTDANVAKISATFKANRIDNFKIWRAEARKLGIIPNSNIKFRKTKYLAFLYGLTLGDGHLAKTSRTECLRIVLGTDKPNLITYVAKVIKQVIKKAPSVIKRASSNAVNITLYQNNLSKRLGVPTGARRNLHLKFPKWIWERKTCLLSTLRGLYEAEASLSIHLKTYTYNLSFSNMNISLLNEVERALIHLGFHPERRINAVRLRRKTEVFELAKLISFRTYSQV